MTLITSTDRTVPVTVQTRSPPGPPDAFRFNVPILQQAKGGTDMETVKSADGSLIACGRRGRGDSGDTGPFAPERSPVPAAGGV
jgi:hypothetical protein